MGIFERSNAERTCTSAILSISKAASISLTRALKNGVKSIVLTAQLLGVNPL